jgi:hypothetical protein
MVNAELMHQELDNVLKAWSEPPTADRQMPLLCLRRLGEPLVSDAVGERAALAMDMDVRIGPRP